MRIIGLVVVLLFVWTCADRPRQGVWQQVEALMEQQPDSALRFLEGMNTKSLSRKERAQYALLYIQAAIRDNRELETDSLVYVALDYYSGKEDSPELARCWFYQGEYYRQTGLPEEAMEAFLNAEKLAFEKNEYNLLGAIYDRLAMLHKDQLDISRSLNFASLSIFYFHEGGKQRNENYEILAKGRIFLFIDQPDSCLHYANEAAARALARRDTAIYALCLNLKSDVYLKEGELQKAKETAKKSIECYQDSVPSGCYASLADVYYEEGELDSAIYCVNRALQKSGERIPEAELYLRLKKIEEKRENTGSALRYANRVIQQLDSLYENFQKHSVSEFERRYKYEQVRDEAAVLKIENARLLVVIIFLLMGVVGIVLYVVSGRKRDLLIRRLQQERFERKLLQQENRLAQLGEHDQKLKDILRRQIDVTRQVIVAMSVAGKQNMDYKSILAELLAVKKWEEFEDGINMLYDGFADYVRRKYPQLTETDLKLCCLTCAGFTTKEIASFMNITDSTINNRRYEITKKVQANEKVKFGEFIEEIKQVLHDRQKTETLK